ncbi:putative CYB2-lactate dehydrogenase cytochrome b2 [Drechmeria coniospora]|uniref:Putative CYB2-lactate dehydrogenase cytochrome b2 n=1 Tax=Drechmeria coniospora TaxID=98403 RepID=A0A151GU26_DRECN|nr:putative CYB2-lactate dehydrogenase cytochrome b2 [Drechmeria coniospora]KYK60624.1 putative CYB2-lactate dehydrogenase cytochrome b2 [Drechmeria coniospora]
MRSATIFTFALANGALAARAFLNEPDTGIQDVLGGLPDGRLPELSSIVGLPDFEWVAKKYMPVRNFSYYRNGAGGEWSYRNNLEVFHRYRLRPRVLVDNWAIESTLSMYLPHPLGMGNNEIVATILGHIVSAPFFISPAARAHYAHPDAKLNLVKAAGAEKIMYMPALYASKTINEIAAAKKPGQGTFQQLHLSSNRSGNQELFDRAEKSGAMAIVFTVDSAADGNRHRAARFGVGSVYVLLGPTSLRPLDSVPTDQCPPRPISSDPDYSSFTWNFYRSLTNMTRLPIILKGIMTVKGRANGGSQQGAGHHSSNHGGRQLDGSPSSLEVALEIHDRAPDVFKGTEVYADGGIRYGAYALMLEI